ncbi:MAG: hypothetical protein K0S51_1775 [Bacillales bacterium]|nr:hypothetical protein [Bacillales bacterium]
MSKEQPRFKVGDIVVVHANGTIGKVTKVKYIDPYYVYEINNNEGLYFENSIRPVDNYDGKPPHKEVVEISFEYQFGDLVKVSGYGEELYKIVGKRTEIWRYKNDSWEDIIYELSRLKDGEWLEANEEDLILIANVERAQQFIKKIKSLKTPISKLDSEKLKSINEYKKLGVNPEKRQIIDGLLDVYNDYHLLYNYFQDEEYKLVMEIVLKNLKKITEHKKI